MSSSDKTVVWFRRDLRIEDNPALAAVARDAAAVLPVFIWCPDEEAQFYPGRVSRWWLKQSLAHLDRSLRSLGSPLVLIRSQSTLAALLQCLGAIGATKVLFNHLYDPVSLLRDHKVRSQLTALGISVQSFNADLLYEPWEVYDANEHAFTTFDAFWKKCMDLPMELTSSLPPWRLVPVTGRIDNIQSSSIEDLGLENESEKPSNELLSMGWSPGWSNADKALSEFVEGHLPRYSRNRMKVEGATTSLLSPYLHFGELSVRKIYRNVRMKQIQWAKEGNLEAEESVRLFLRSIGLREYSRYICFNFPFTHERSLMGNLRHYPWCEDEMKFKCWRQGRTGYPLVDAGMRELWATGWIHNRVRVIVASFLVKFLLIPWTWGMKYFWDTLLDADLENDILGWQYVSGSLPDGHELDRLDSPQIQGHKFDPDGEYVRNWIPELVRMPTEWIHHPWDAPPSVLDAAGVELDREEKIANLTEKGEEVADNLIDMNTLDIPRVAVRKEVSCASASLDQRVPSFHNVEGKSSDDNRSKDADDQRQIQPESDSQVQVTTIDERSLSTAESSTARKRSIGSSLSAVPDTCLFSSEVNTVKVYASHASTGSSVHLRQETGQLGGEKEEDDVDAETSNNMLRPTKRAG
uniref:Photolyase/cryptochrome alpha/beta domain-containing protein n=1 Tax=Ananas comosus var. bracteatus TaxID=296719 RepID=A0A6V7PZK3_ANACO|nr:unnamed protein product [Ananas comosus var. bracteatus]